MRDTSARWRQIASAAIAKGLCPLCRVQLVPDPLPFEAGHRCPKCHALWTGSR